MEGRNLEGIDGLKYGRLKGCYGGERVKSWRGGRMKVWKGGRVDV